ncbi:MAG: hypothetical protein KY461_05465 [Actinobacteria bacterium]|nr:hypothetical protein [Actinomycetota bacterium]
MHPVISQQIASHQAEELRRRAELRRRHAPARRVRHVPGTSGRARASLGQVWALLTTFSRA